MRKLVKEITILTILILVSMGVKVYAATPTLEQIANAFNNCSTVKEYATYGTVWNATSNGNKLTISVTADNTTKNLEYTLENSILSANLSGNFTFAILAANNVLIDSIGQLHGYSDGELFSTLNSDKISSYTIENEGFEIDNFQIKIDISKKIPLIDFSNVYIEVSDLQDLKDYITGDGSAEKNKGNIWFNKSGYDGENTLIIAEQNSLTDNTYKSILSIIEVMFDSSKASDYFKTNYSGISDGNKEFAGFKIEINPIKTEFEELLLPSDSGCEFARITIDKDLVNSAIDGKINNTENKEEYKKTYNSNDTEIENSNSAEEQDNTLSQGDVPQTGLNMALPIVSIIIITVIACYIL